MPHEYYLENLLPVIGCELKIEHSKFVHESVFGFRTEQKEGKTLVTAIAPGSAAEMHLSLDDHLIAINGRQLDNNLNLLLQQSGRCELTLFRNRYLHTILLEPNGRFFYQQYTVGKLTDASETQKKEYRKWLYGGDRTTD